MKKLIGRRKAGLLFFDGKLILGGWGMVGGQKKNGEGYRTMH